MSQAPEPKAVHQHVYRRMPPWRTKSEALTECGLPAASYATVTVEEMRAKVAREGRQRASYSSCMTCWDAATRHWEYRTNDAVCAAVLRDLERGRFTPEEPIVRELGAIAILVERHREEFDALLSDLSDVVKISDVRDRKNSPR